MANKRKGNKQSPKVNEVASDETLDYVKELFAMSKYVQQYASGASLTDISLDDLYNMLKNPYANIERIQSTARYMSNRYGIIRDVIEAFKYLPTLNYHLVWSNYENPAKIKKYEKKVYDLLDTLQINKVVRDGLGEQAEVGHVIAVNRKNKFIQFLDYSQVRINKQLNGNWVIEIDMSKITGNTDEQIKSAIDSLPEEITFSKYKAYKAKSNDEKFRFIEIKNAYILPIRGNRYYPNGFPITFASWGAFLHKTLIEQLEKSTVDKLIKSVLIMVAKSIGESNKAYSPPKAETVKKYFRDLIQLIEKKGKGGSTNSKDNSGTGVVVLPEFLGLEEVKVNATLPTKDLYDKLDKDIFSSIGVSSSLIYGGGNESNYGSAQMNSEKFFKYIFGALEQWEWMINNIIKTVLPTDLNCKFYFDKTTITNKVEDITAKKDFYMQTGIWIPYAEAVLGVPYTYALGVKEYQDKVLGLEDIIKPPQNAFTQSGTTPTDDSKNGRPKKALKDKKDSSIKNDGNKGNDIPSPSDK